jgi:hypothetical protein
LQRNYRATPINLGPIRPGCSNSPRSCDAERRREDAAYFRHRAAAVAEDQRLHDSYLGLAIEYERLAEVLERIPCQRTRHPLVPRAATPRDRTLPRGRRAHGMPGHPRSAFRYAGLFWRLIWPGELPVQRLKAWLNAPISEYPRSQAICCSETRRS